VSWSVSRSLAVNPEGSQKLAGGRAQRHHRTRRPPVVSARRSRARGTTSDACPSPGAVRILLAASGLASLRDAGTRHLHVPVVGAALDHRLISGMTTANLWDRSAVGTGVRRPRHPGGRRCDCPPRVTSPPRLVEPGGFAEISRGSSAALPPGDVTPSRPPHPGGGAIDRHPVVRNTVPVVGLWRARKRYSLASLRDAGTRHLHVPVVGAALDHRLISGMTTG
jgi:hypothetical protein